MATFRKSYRFVFGESHALERGNFGSLSGYVTLKFRFALHDVSNRHDHTSGSELVISAGLETAHKSPDLSLLRVKRAWKDGQRNGRDRLL